jgi:hypothetical protein
MYEVDPFQSQTVYDVGDKDMSGDILRPSPNTGPKGPIVAVVSQTQQDLDRTLEDLGQCCGPFTTFKRTRRNLITRYHNSGIILAITDQVHNPD